MFSADQQLSKSLFGVFLIFVDEIRTLLEFDIQ